MISPATSMAPIDLDDHSTNYCLLIQLRIGGTGRAIFFQFICFTENLENIFSQKYTSLM